MICGIRSGVRDGISCAAIAIRANYSSTSCAVSGLVIARICTQFAALRDADVRGHEHEEVPPSGTWREKTLKACLAEEGNSCEPAHVENLTEERAQ